MVTALEGPLTSWHSDSSGGYERCSRFPGMTLAAGAVSGSPGAVGAGGGRVPPLHDYAPLEEGGRRQGFGAGAESKASQGSRCVQDRGQGLPDTCWFLPLLLDPSRVSLDQSRVSAELAPESGVGAPQIQLIGNLGVRRVAKFSKAKSFKS